MLNGEDEKKCEKLKESEKLLEMNERWKESD